VMATCPVPYCGGTLEFFRFLEAVPGHYHGLHQLNLTTGPRTYYLYTVHCSKCKVTGPAGWSEEVASKLFEGWLKPKLEAISPQLLYQYMARGIPMNEILDAVPEQPTEDDENDEDFY
jgi:hypothetical protein